MAAASDGFQNLCGKLISTWVQILGTMMRRIQVVEVITQYAVAKSDRPLVPPVPGSPRWHRDVGW